MTEADFSMARCQVLDRQHLNIDCQNSCLESRSLARGRHGGTIAGLYLLYFVDKSARGVVASRLGPVINISIYSNE